MGGFPNLNLTSIPFPYSCINFPNQFLDDWAQKTKWVVDNFIDFSLDIAFSPLAQGFDDLPLPIPCEIMPRLFIIVAHH